MTKKTILEVLEDINTNPKEFAVKMQKDYESQQEEYNLYLENFLTKIKAILVDSKENNQEFKIEENGLYVSKNIEKIQKEVSNLGWNILNMSDFEKINNCPANQTGFLYTDLLNLKLEVEKKKLKGGFDKKIILTKY